MSGGRQWSLGGGVQHLLDNLKRMQLESASFFYAVEGGNNHSIGTIFWVDAASRMNYNFFGDTVIFDTMYRRNQYKLPFASFTGLNHHGQPVLFGCALLLNESESSFVWLFQTWLNAMSGQYPVSITTDPDQLIQVSVVRVFPQTRHRFSKWGIFRDTQKKLAQIYHTHPTFEAEFQKCINESGTIEEFEICWESLLKRYYLMDNEWLHSMHNARQHWVPVYMRNTFFGEISMQPSDGISLFFDGHVNATTTIQGLVKQYDSATASWHEKELQADYDTTNTSPVLKTPSPMEKQAAGLYTRRIFLKFQEELVETLANPATKIDESGAITTYRVAKFGEELKAQTVKFDAFEMKASCSCQMFEFSGIICRHILAVFRAKNVLTLPSPYVLKRWTRNARSGSFVDECASDSGECLNVRYNSLRQEAIKYVEEGAKSIRIYNVAMEALQDAGKKVAAAKSRGSGAKQDCDIEIGGSLQMQALEGNLSAPQYLDDKEKKIRELNTELDSTNQRCEVYRANLLAVLKDLEEQKLKLSVKVQNARLTLRE